MFVNTATFVAADNEAQLAGVMAHEMSHVVLRHGTHQMSKQNLIQLPAMLAGNLAGDGMMGALARLGVNLGANSLLLKYSRDAEAQADYNGALMMADAGYNPLEMARFFEKLETKGSEGALAQFLSDHPTPGNRVNAVEREIQYLPQKNYKEDLTGQLPDIKALVKRLPPPPVKPRQAQQ
jgi:predicted Zn-dependent protease